MIYYTGKNADFTATWDFHRQEYRVYKSGKLIRTVHRFRDVKSYLD